jgi:hypothetical protein
VLLSAEPIVVSRPCIREAAGMARSSSLDGVATSALLQGWFDSELREILGVDRYNKIGEASWRRSLRRNKFEFCKD